MTIFFDSFTTALPHWVIFFSSLLHFFHFFTAATPSRHGFTDSEALGISPNISGA
jgi:hypothetical protein